MTAKRAFWGLGKRRVVFYASIVVTLVMLAPSDEVYHTAEPVDTEIIELREKKKKKEAEYRSKLSKEDQVAFDKLKEDKVFKNILRLALIIPIFDVIFVWLYYQKIRFVIQRYTSIGKDDS